MTREHLSDEALNDVLIGVGTSVSESHLAECPLCRGKVDEFQSDLGMWNAATLQWSEARAERAGRIQASRAQEANQKVITNYDNRLTRTIQTFTRSQ